MKNSTLEALAVSITAIDGQRATLANLIGERHDARLLIEGNITAALSALDAATAALEPALVREAVGEAEPGEVAAARATLATAEKALTTARKREGEARELAAAENGLNLRVSGLDAQLADLRRQRSDARLAAVVADLHARIGSYLASAGVTAQRFAEVLALDDYLTRDLAKPQNVRTAETPLACLPAFAGHVSTTPSFDVLMRAARAGIVAEHGTGPL